MERAVSIIIVSKQPINQRTIFKRPTALCKIATSNLYPRKSWTYFTALESHDVDYISILGCPTRTQHIVSYEHAHRSCASHCFISLAIECFCNRSANLSILIDNVEWFCYDYKESTHDLTSVSSNIVSGYYTLGRAKLDSITIRGLRVHCAMSRPLVKL